jgi:diguanylate cyclase (GGDEF)-like protein
VNITYPLILLNPVLGIVFATVFLVLWRHDQSRRYALLLAAAYTASATGFVLQKVDLPFGPEISRFASGAAFIAAASMIAIAMARRYARPVPGLALGSFALAGLCGTAFFAIVEPNIVGRVYAVTFAVGAILLVAAAEIRAGSRAPIDRWLMGIIAFNGLLMFVRSVLFVYTSDNIVESELEQSQYWAAFIFSHSLMSLIIATSLATAVVLDVITDLSTRSSTDVLSGVLNRRGFEEAALLARSGRSQMPVALILCDLDHFKKVNDTFGHQVGDEVIASFGRVMMDVVGRTHPLGRIGGEEFAILLLGGSTVGARTVAMGIGAAYSQLVRPNAPEGGTHVLTASFGVAEWRAGEQFADLMSRADGALYAAKHQGRNRVVVEGEIVSAPEARRLALAS